MARIPRENRWILAAWMNSVGSGQRVERGRAYARKGHVQAMYFDAGYIGGRVLGTRAEPYSVNITFPEFTQKEWQSLLLLPNWNRWITTLNQGRFPTPVAEAIDDALDGDLSLIPKGQEMSFSCNCPDWVSPCKHIVAVLHEMGIKSARDPRQLFALRGKPWEKFITELTSLAPRSRPRVEGPATTINGVVLAQGHWVDPKAFWLTEEEPNLAVGTSNADGVSQEMPAQRPKQIIDLLLDHVTLPSSLAQEPAFANRMRRWYDDVYQWVRTLADSGDEAWTHLAPPKE